MQSSALGCTVLRAEPLPCVRVGLRGLSSKNASQRGFAAVAVLTIALGVGTTTAVFSVIDAVLLRGLPYQDSERLVAVHESQHGELAPREVSYPNFLDWQSGLRSVEAMAAYAHYGFTMVVGDATELLDGARISWNYFDVLGVEPIHGRSLEQDDDIPARRR